MRMLRPDLLQLSPVSVAPRLYLYNDELSLGSLNLTVAKMHIKESVNVEK